MLKRAARAALLVAMCSIMTAAAPSPPPARKTTAGLAVFAGKLEFTIVDDMVRLAARGAGWSSPWGEVVAAEATWSPKVDDVMALFAGQLDALTVNTGTFAVEFASGDTIRGALKGTIRPRDDGTFGLESAFIATNGTGRFAGVSGGGTLGGVDDPESLEFRAMLHAKLSVPR